MLSLVFKLIECFMASLLLVAVILQNDVCFHFISAISTQNIWIQRGHIVSLGSKAL